MIDFLSSWAEQIIVAVIIASIIEMILPENKNKKYVKMVIGIYILFNIISPFINEKDLLSMDSISLESYASTDTGTSIETEQVNQASMDERLQQLYIEELENNIKIKVQQEGYDVNYCKVDAILKGDEKEQGINKINLTVTKNKNEIKNNSDIQAVNKIEVNVGLNKYIKTEEEQGESKINNEEIQDLKNALSTYYEIDSNKINISIK